MNRIRLYFETKDPLSRQTLECFADFEKREYYLDNTEPREKVTETIITDWGVLYDREVIQSSGNMFMSGGRKVQPAWFLPIVEAKKETVIFPEDNGVFNQYPK